MRRWQTGDMLSIISLALIVIRGIILAGWEAVQTVGIYSSQFNDVMMQMTVMVMKLAPYSVFCLTARHFPALVLTRSCPFLSIWQELAIASHTGLVVYMAIRVLQG